MLTDLMCLKTMLAEREDDHIELLTEIQNDLKAYGDRDGYDHIDVRLQWVETHLTFHHGDPCFDQDHRGVWGCAVVCVCHDPHDTLEEMTNDLLEAWHTNLNLNEMEDTDG